MICEFCDLVICIYSILHDLHMFCVYCAIARKTYFLRRREVMSRFSVDKFCLSGLGRWMCRIVLVIIVFLNIDYIVRLVCPFIWTEVQAKSLSCPSSTDRWSVTFRVASSRHWTFDWQALRDVENVPQHVRARTVFCDGDRIHAEAYITGGMEVRSAQVWCKKSPIGRRWVTAVDE